MTFTLTTSARITPQTIQLSHLLRALLCRHDDVGASPLSAPRVTPLLPPLSCLIVDQILMNKSGGDSLPCNILLLSRCVGGDAGGDNVRGGSSGGVKGYVRPVSRVSRDVASSAKKA